MSHRDGDGGDVPESGDEEFSAEDEFRRWAEETGAGPDEEPGGRQSWAARIFGRRDKTEEPAAVDDLEPAPEPEPDLGPSPADLEDTGPEQLGVFPIIRAGDTPPFELHAVGSPDDTATEPESGAGADDSKDDVAATEPTPEYVAAGQEPVTESAVPEPGTAAVPERDEDDQPVSTGAPATGSADFARLWGGHAEGDPGERGDDVAEFTNEDYLAATTREYAGLAEAVARAEEEGTQQIAVSAGIRGLETGLVGLDDMVDAAGGAASADVIEPPSGSELSIRVLTATGLVVLFAASLLSPYGIGALIFVVLGIAAGEMFAAFIRGGYRPLSIFGFLGIAGAFAGTWAAGPVAVPVALLITTVAVFLFYATVPGRRAAVENAALTVLVTAWIGGAGAFAFDLLGSEDYVWLVLALVVTVAAMDIAQFFIGRRIGRRPLAPVVSPKKTVEGYVAGVVVAIAFGAAFAWAPPFELSDGLLIGVIVAAIGPLGDLAVSVLKRALGVKDMGYILPGHGGVLDRVDAMIFTIPALWIAYSWMGLLN